VGGSRFGHEGPHGNSLFYHGVSRDPAVDHLFDFISVTSSTSITICKNVVIIKMDAKDVFEPCEKQIVNVTKKTVIFYNNNFDLGNPWYYW
jgi:hypothetical protein